MWTKEQARLAGARSAEVRKRRAELMRTGQGSQVAKEMLEQRADLFAQQLIDAAEGKGVYDKLDPKERLGAVLKALEYAVGRPSQAKPAVPTGNGEPSGLVIE